MEGEEQCLVYSSLVYYRGLWITAVAKATGTEQKKRKEGGKNEQL